MRKLLSQQQRLQPPMAAGQASSAHASTHSSSSQLVTSPVQAYSPQRDDNCSCSCLQRHISLNLQQYARLQSMPADPTGNLWVLTLHSDSASQPHHLFSPCTQCIPQQPLFAACLLQLDMCTSESQQASPPQQTQPLSTCHNKQRAPSQYTLYMPLHLNSRNN